MATWLGRSAAAGSGVVPLAAARAWRCLKADLACFGMKSVAGSTAVKSWGNLR